MKSLRRVEGLRTLGCEDYTTCGVCCWVVGLSIGGVEAWGSMGGEVGHDDENGVRLAFGVDVGRKS